MERVRRMVTEKPAVIFSKSYCCMSHSIKALFSDLGVYPAVHELDQMPRGRDVEQALAALGCNPTVPAVFIGGQLVGGESEVMTLHLQRSLKPMLKKAGALWV
ncbi:monothiol glutaredoxin-S3-like [Ipomoea triloba]|uniref:monothiol glutaredoxin-S3-like n=1 Tax=Ipomoea triloba TaxID=35885 RepID=UPI00125DD22D|nr:monothiol glutaredoxin-S3-like [Ipomoea triloba]